MLAGSCKGYRESSIPMVWYFLGFTLQAEISQREYQQNLYAYLDLILDQAHELRELPRVRLTVQFALQEVQLCESLLP